MTIAVLSFAPFLDYRYSDESIQEVLEEDGPFEQRAISVMPLARRHWFWSRKDQGDDALAIKAFRIARQHAYEAFFLKDPVDFLRETVSLGVGDGAKLTFDLPLVLSDDAYRGFPIPGTVEGSTVAGVFRAVASVNTEGRQVTLSGAAPGVGVAVKLTRYQEYRLCRFTNQAEWLQHDKAWTYHELEIVEAFRNL